ncbi:MAG: response regulator [Gammaproteobacteria bacterium]|jgi:two-component system response regulator FixJ
MNRISDDSKPETDSVLYVVGGTEEDRRSLGALLSRLGREVRNKSSAEELLETLTPARPFVLVSTISLPGMDGMELLRELRNRGIPAPTILISDQSDIPTAVDAIRAGAADFIERPFIDRVLLRRVQSALETSDAA